MSSGENAVISCVLTRHLSYETVQTNACLIRFTALLTTSNCLPANSLLLAEVLSPLPVQSANVGDSSAIFCHSNKDPAKEYIKMTVDHRISDPGEKKRLAAMGIELGKNKNRLYGLNLSRCLGDHFIKEADLGFIATPSVSEVVQLGSRDSGLAVIASDGLWDVTKPGRVMQVRSPPL